MKKNNRIKENWHYYRRILINLLIIVGLILSVVGSWQVYFPQLGWTPKLIAVIPFSVVKLFSFFPTKNLMEDLPLAYLLAVWIAPLGTVLGLFSVFKNNWERFKFLFAKFRKDYYLVIGFNDESRVFIEKLNETTPKPYVSVIIPIEQEPLYKAEAVAMGINFIPLVYQKSLHLSNIKFIKSLNLHKLKKIISFEKEPYSYGHIKVLAEVFQQCTDQVFDVWLAWQDEKLRDLIELSMDQLLNFNIHYFSIPELMMVRLVSIDKFPLHRTQHWHKPAELADDKLSMQKISQQIGHVHIALFGLSDLGKHALHTILNQCQVCLNEKIHLTIIDPQADQQLENYRSKVTQLDKMVQLRCVETPLGYRETADALREINRQDPFTAVLYTLENVKASILSLDSLEAIFAELPIALYCSQKSDFEPLINAMMQKYHQLQVFGYLEDYLKPKLIFNEAWYSRAKAYNHLYQKYAAQIMAWQPPTESAEQSWQQISAVKKQSSLYQTLHQVVKADLLDRFIVPLSRYNSAAELLNAWQQAIAAKDPESQVVTIEQDPLKNYMTALEHKRWNAFYYRKDFKYGPVKNEAAKTHNCLIDDWQEFLQVGRNTVIYDFLSTLSLQKKS